MSTQAEQILPTILQPSVGNQVQQEIFQSLLNTAGYGPGPVTTNPDGSVTQQMQTFANLPQVDMSKTMLPQIYSQFQAGMPASFTPAPLAALQNNQAGQNAMTSMTNTGYASDQLKATAESYLAPFLHPAPSGASGANPMAYHAPTVGAPPNMSMFNQPVMSAPAAAAVGA